MSNTWFIADLHHRHKNILNFENRPFSSIEEMEEEMIKAWNLVVEKTDKIYVLGDFCFGGHKAWIEILDQLKGEIILISGNHDRAKITSRVLREGYLSEVYEIGKILKVDNYILNLTHYPLEIGNRPFNFNISGHIHSEPSKYMNQINVGVDSSFMDSYYLNTGALFGTPVPLDYLMSIIEGRNEVVKQYKEKGM